MTARVLILGFLGVFTLAGCENTRMAEYNPFGQGAADARSAEHVQMRADTGEMTPLPSAPLLRQEGQVFDPRMETGSVMISDPMVNLGPNPAFAPPPLGFGGPHLPSLPSYANGTLAADSSVTIFSLDGAPQMMSNNQMAGGFDNYSAGGMAQGHVPYNSSGNQIFFKNGSSRLGGGDMHKLSTVAEEAKFAPVNRITVAGYASPPTQAGSHSVEGHILNLKESMNRSFAVSKALMKKGVPAEKIKTVSWGATKPTGNNTQDRRVDIIMGEQ